MRKKASMEDRLAESFMELAVKKPIEKITIQEITDGADVIRSTFYNHFQDKYELLEWIIYEKLLNSLDVLLENGMIREAIIVAGRNILHDKEFYKCAVKLEGQNSFESIVEDAIKKIFLKFFFKAPHVEEVHSANNPWITPERMAGYVAHGLSYIFIMWIEADMCVPPEQMAEIFTYIEDKSLLDVVREMGVEPELISYDTIK